VTKSGLEQQGAGSSVDEGGVAAFNRSCRGHHRKGTWLRCRVVRGEFEFGSPDHQEKVLSTTLVRDNQFIVIWVKLYVAVHHKSLYISYMGTFC
jgi:hypothetical protein